MTYTQEFQMLENEFWWGGAVHDGIHMPLDCHSDYHIDLSHSHRGNQAVPLFISTKGRYLWSEDAFDLTCHEGKIIAVSEVNEITLCTASTPTLRGAYMEAMLNHFPFDGSVPEPLFYTVPQYNTWAELTYNQNQKDVLEYARNIIKNGYAPGILMIDDMWQEDYGVWKFHKERFPDPKAMCDELHALGFKLMLWIVPYISPDSREFRQAEQIPGCIITDTNGAPQLLRWWNGYSACINLCSDSGKQWFDDQLHPLIEKYGVDGFKFDGADTDSYCNLPGVTPEEAASYTQAWFNYGGGYPLHEMKDTWKAGGKPWNQRLRDKSHAWQGEGLDCVIPDAFNASLTGHPFLCPDMVGGGEWTYFLPGSNLDEELIVRFAQASALFPMLQFSVAPWRVMKEPFSSYVKACADLHTSLGGRIFEMVKKAAKIGEPIMTPLCYYYPEQNYERITDQFLLGENILVAPVIHKGVVDREVVLPDGTWKLFNGTIYEGGKTVKIPSPLNTLLWFEKIK